MKGPTVTEYFETSSKKGGRGRAQRSLDLIDCHDYPNYGGRGIRVCERWNSFEDFLADMGEPPRARTLDRIDVNDNYRPGSVRWATASEQARNKRSNVSRGGKADAGEAEGNFATLKRINQ
jgi:hypothetical protein